MLGCVVDAAAYEAVEVGAGGDARGGRVPELVVAADVLGIEDNAACAVGDDKHVVGIALVLHQSADDKVVVEAVAVGSDSVGESERAVAMVTVPEDMEVVVNDAIAACLVDEVEGHVADGVGEEAVEESPWELVFDNGIENGGVAVGFDVDEIGDGAVLPLAALQGDVEDGVGVGCHTVERVGQLTRTDVGECRVEDIVDDGEVIVKQCVTVWPCAGKEQLVATGAVESVAVGVPRQGILHHGIVESKCIVEVY